MNQFVQFFLVMQLEHGVEFSSHHARDSAINVSSDCNTCSPTFLSGGTNGTSCSQMQRRASSGSSTMRATLYGQTMRATLYGQS